MFLKLEDVLFPKVNHYASNFGILKGSVVNNKGVDLAQQLAKIQKNYIRLTGNFGGFCTWLSCPRVPSSPLWSPSESER